jgi:hypothetical protein
MNSPAKQWRDQVPHWMMEWALKRSENPYQCFSPERLGVHFAEKAIPQRAEGD